MQTNKYLFEINHPCHAHLFKHVIKAILKKGHKVDVFIKQSSLIQVILAKENIPFIIQGRKGSPLFFKTTKQILFTRQIISLHKQNNYNLAIGVSVSLPLASRFSKLQSLVLDDDDKKATPYFAWLAHRNASMLLRPDCLTTEGEFGNTVYHHSLHELTYLHPSVFKPDKRILSVQGIGINDRFFLIRLSALKAHHDIGKSGIGVHILQLLVSLLQNHGKVIVMHEEGITFKGVEPLKIPPERIHHLMAHASLVISDGQTMCSEAACLGIPSVRINDFAGRISYLDELEHKWKLSFGFKPSQSERAFDKIKEILEMPLEVFQERRNELLKDKIKLNNLLKWFIFNYPKSFKIMKENPYETQKQFY